MLGLELDAELLRMGHNVAEYHSGAPYRYRGVMGIV